MRQGGGGREVLSHLKAPSLDNHHDVGDVLRFFSLTDSSISTIVRQNLMYKAAV